MKPGVFSLILASFLTTNAAIAAQSLNTGVSVNKTMVSSSVVQSQAPALSKNPLILDNSRFDIKELLKPEVRKSLNQKIYGPGSGGGGNICGVNIQRVTADILRYIQTLPAGNTVAEPLKRAMAHAKFMQGTNMMLRGQKVNAINYPEMDMIVMDADGCALLEKNDITSKNFLLHEYLGLAGIEDTNYQISSNMVNDMVRIQNSQTKTNAFRIIPNTTVGKWAVAFGIAGKEINSDLYDSDDTYRHWVNNSYVLLYLVNLDTNEITDVIQIKGTETSIPFGDASITLLGDGKTSLMLICNHPFGSEILAAYSFSKALPIKSKGEVISTLNKSLSDLGDGSSRFYIDGWDTDTGINGTYQLMISFHTNGESQHFVNKEIRVP